MANMSGNLHDTGFMSNIVSRFGYKIEEVFKEITDNPLEIRLYDTNISFIQNNKIIQTLDYFKCIDTTDNTALIAIDRLQNKLTPNIYTEIIGYYKDKLKQ